VIKVSKGIAAALLQNQERKERRIKKPRRQLAFVNEPSSSTDSVTIMLGLPPAALYPNARPNWYELAEARKIYRREACVCARLALGGRRPMVRAARVAVTMEFLRMPWPDPDNCAAALKACWDGLQDAGLLANDDQLVHEPIERYGAQPGTMGRVVVRVSW
jgi:Holliday junction resolvase RusA-like endonuclease